LIGVDTNVLVRFLTADEPGQHQQAVSFFGSRTPESPAFISAVTLVETIWVLRRAYRLEPAEIMDSLGLFLDSDDFVVECRHSLELVRKGAGTMNQLNDFIVAELGERAGCAATMTLDRRAARAVPSMELLA